MNILPSKRSSAWLMWFLVYGLVLSLIFWLNRFMVVGETFSVDLALKFAVAAFVLSAIANGLGWFGAKWVWFFTTAGILIGLMFMFVVGARDHTGWEDLSSLAMFAVGAASGFAAGLIVESIMWIVRKRKS